MMWNNIALRAMGVSPSNLRAATVVSKRAPQGALSRMWDQDPSQPMYPDFSGEAAIELAYMKNVYTYRCVDSIASTIAGWPFRAGDQVSTRYRLTHPLAQLLGPAAGSANPNFSSYTLWRYAIAQYLVLGKFAWAIERNGAGEVSGLWPLQAQHLNPVAATSGSNYFEYFQYGQRGQRGYKEFKPRDIVYIYRPSLKDFRLPESPVQMAAVNINIAKMLDQFDYSFLKNGGVPAHLIITPPFASDEQRDGFQSQFMADFSGSANVGKAMFAERDIQVGESNGGIGFDTVDVKTIGTTQRDAQLSELRFAEQQAICLGWGVPLSILGDASHRTFSNAQDERINYLQQTCLPRARELQDGINIHLATLLDPTRKVVGWFDTTGVPELRSSPALPDGNEAVTIQAAGGFTWDEWRSERGLPSQKDVGLDKIQTEKEKQAQITAAPAAKDAGSDVLPPANAPAAKTRHAGPGHDPITSGHITTASLESALTVALRREIEAMARAAKERAAGKRSRRGEDVEILDVDYWRDRVSAVLRAHISESTISIGEVQSALLELYGGSTTADNLIARWENV